MTEKHSSSENQKSNSKSTKINVGTIIFLVIFLYIVFSVYSYLNHEYIRYYEVLEGGIFREESYTGIAIREEKAVLAKEGGYLHYYIQEGKRVRVGANIYTIDETGALEKYLSEHPEIGSELSDKQLFGIRTRLSEFSKTFDNKSFDSLYDMKYSLEATTLEYAGEASVKDIDSILNELGSVYLRVTSDESGVVSYNLDGMEDLREADVNAGLFSNEDYQLSVTRPGTRVDTSTPVYKLVTDSNWRIVFLLSDETKALYQDKNRLKIYFPELDLNVQCDFSIYTADDGNEYGRLELNELMEEFIGERYITFEIVNNDRSGLKIPVTAITEKEFYVVPKDFLIEKEENGTNGFLRRTVLADGQAGTEYVETEIYRIDSQYCYLSVPENMETNRIKLGDVIIKENGSQTYSVGPVKSIQGVYNMNKGYCIFRQIVIIESNNEYVIVEKNTDYGISTYDHIVLDASLVTEGQLVYQ